MWRETVYLLDHLINQTFTDAFTLVFALYHHYMDVPRVQFTLLERFRENGGNAVSRRTEWNGSTSVSLTVGPKHLFTKDGNSAKY